LVKVSHVGLAVAAAGLTLGAAEAAGGKSAPTVLTLPLDLNRTKGFELFLRALEDEGYRQTFATNTTAVPGFAAQLVSMVGDRQFTSMATDVMRVLDGYLHRTNSMDEVKQVGLGVHQYLTSTYPEGYRSLKDYAIRVLPQHQREVSQTQLAMSPDVLNQDPASVDANIGGGGGFAVATNVAALAEAAVNAVVYANVAVATMAVVAIAAVAVVAVVAA
jgi:hypothetical protein